jgi:hypothetical protein
VDQNEENMTAIEEEELEQEIREEETANDLGTRNVATTPSIKRIAEKKKGSKRPATGGDPRISETLGILRTVANQQIINEKQSTNDDCSIYGQHVTSLSY